MQMPSKLQPQATQPLLQIRGLQAEIDGKRVLDGIDLDSPPGEVAVIMGPNGSGKTTLAQVLAGRDLYRVSGGTVRFDGQDLLALPPQERLPEQQRHQRLRHKHRRFCLPA